MCALSAKSWPLPLSRSYYEHMALTEQAKHAPHLVPKIYGFDRNLALIVMEYLTPHMIMRKGLIRGIEYPLFAAISPNSWRRRCSTPRVSRRPPSRAQGAHRRFRRQYRNVQDHRGPGLHRSLSRRQAQPLDQALISTTSPPQFRADAPLKLRGAGAQAAVPDLAPKR